jgi:isoquinoline 1-oxidoreductase beta subunit
MKPSSTQLSPTRRKFLVGSGGLALTVLLSGGRVRAAEAASAAAGKLSAYIEILPDGRVAIVTPGAEMGQGVASSLPKIVAEEMDADWSRVVVRLSGADEAFRDAAGRQRSANSDAVTGYFEPLRKVGATARHMLVAAAAARWGVSPDEITVENGTLRHPASGRALRFADVSADAAKIPIPAEVKLKDPSQFKLLGKTAARKDIPPKVTGEAVFGMDLVLPGLLYAAILHVPEAGGRLAGYDAAAAQAMPGVRKVVALDDAVAVFGESYWQAQNAVDRVKLKVEADRLVDTEGLRTRLLAGLDGDGKMLPFPVGREGGEFLMGLTADEFEAALASAPRTFSADYEVPYLAHATMEPVCATVLVEDDACTVWAPMQSADMVPPEVAEVLGLRPDQVTLHRTYVGGGFGRKNERDFVLEAARIAKAMPGVPVMLVWSRQQDTRHDFYRPACAVRTRVALEEDGTVRAIHSRIAAQPLTAPSPYRMPQFADGSIAGGLISSVYEMGGRRIDSAEMNEPVRTGYWRSVSLSQNGFFSEIVIDDVAHELGLDPLDYRLKLAAKDPRSIAVLRRAAEAAGWRAPRAPGTGMGIALTSGWNSRCAQIVEVAVEEKRLSVTRVTCAFDCGLQIDPDNVVAQIEGGIIFGLSAALLGQITFDAGVAQQSTFSDYPVVTMINSPEIDVHLVASDAGVGGVGEAGVPAVAPALSSAIFNATGERVRRLPVITQGFEVKR